MKNKTVSIIIPAYNEEKYLPLCLNSISSLDYSKEHIEIIVVDNGSTDRTREIARSYGARLLRDDTQNVSGLRNYGSKKSKGDILAFVDADCLVPKEWLNNASKYFEAMDVVAWGAPPVPPENPTWVQKTWYLVRQKPETVPKVDWLESMNLFVRKDQFFAVGGFNESLVTCEDVDLCYRLSKYGRITSDSQIEIIHLGEAPTVKVFIKKEIWRGRSNLSGIFSHGLSLKELPSLSIPLYFGLFLPVLYLCFIVFSDPVWLAVGLLLYLLPSAAVLIKLRKKKVSPADVIRLLFLIQIYFYSRTIAVLKKS